MTPPRIFGRPTWTLIWMPERTRLASALPVRGNPKIDPRLDSARSGSVTRSTLSEGSRTSSGRFSKIVTEPSRALSWPARLPGPST